MSSQLAMNHGLRTKSTYGGPLLVPSISPFDCNFCGSRQSRFPTILIMTRGVRNERTLRSPVHSHNIDALHCGRRAAHARIYSCFGVRLSTRQHRQSCDLVFSTPLIYCQAYHVTVKHSSLPRAVIKAYNNES